MLQEKTFAAGTANLNYLDYGLSSAAPLVTNGYDYEHIFANIRCPVLFLRGETHLGAVMADDEMAWLQQNCSNVKCVSINGVGHLLHLENHGQRPVLTEMLAFLKNI